MFKSFSLLGAAPHSPDPGLLRDSLRLGFILFVWLAASVSCAAAGPFGTYDALSFPARLGYWGGLIGLALGVAVGLRALMHQVPSRLANHPRAGLAACFVYAVGLGLLIGGINLWLIGSAVATAGFLLEHIILVLVLALVSGAARTYFGRTSEVLASGAEATATDMHVSPFFKRLSTELGTDLIRVSADNHYLEVVTSMGEERILLRLRDAVEELREVPGLQVHRSHWVARGAMAGLRRVGRGHVLDLMNGDQVPVSRGYLDTLRDEGLLD